MRAGQRQSIRFFSGASLLLLLSAQAWAAQPPTITVDPASQVISTAATVTGTVNPNGVPAAFSLQWGLTSDYGSATFFYPIAAVMTPTNVTARMTNLTPSTTYHYRLMATNSGGTGYSADMTVTTTNGPAPGSQPPTVTANAATDITAISATITGTVNPNGLQAGCSIWWGTTTAYDHYQGLADMPAGSAPVPVSTTLSGLAPNTTYHYQLLATNSAGQGTSPDMTFTTMNGPPPPPSQAPTVSTGGAISLTGSSATLTGTLNPNGVPAGYYFRWGATAAYGNVLPTAAVLAGSTPFTVSEGVAGLSPNTMYHFQLVATNAVGTASGDDMSFTTLGTTSDGDFTYSNNNGAITITSYNGPDAYVAIPAVINGLPVTAIGDGAFAYVTNLAGVTIPSTVTDIGAQAFAYCSRLSTVNLGTNVLTIGNGAFFSCASLAEVALSGCLVSIGDEAFYSCSSLTSIAIPDSVTNIGDAAFFNCAALTSLTIGHGITQIRGGGAQMFGTFEGCVSLTTLTIPDNVTNITDGALDFGGSLGAFYGCTGLTNVFIGKGLAHLGTGAFSWCASLTSLYFQGNAPTPGQNMFGEDIFHNSDSATLYYLPGTTGWGPTYAGRPTMLWDAQVQSGNFGIQKNSFNLTITGTAGNPVVIEACTDLALGDWVAVETCMVTNGLLNFTDFYSTNYPTRFYRVRSP
ncbi:MAG TPA: leucine-rich repeat protein [Verrucomicrobiae bacterium]|nr:leucine-rich repeat protein [Verrucomicrobiae bacterium]